MNGSTSFLLFASWFSFRLSNMFGNDVACDYSVLNKKDSQKTVLGNLYSVLLIQ